MGTDGRRQLYLISAALGLRELVTERRDPYWCAARVDVVSRRPEQPWLTPPPLVDHPLTTSATTIVLGCLDEGSTEPSQERPIASLQDDATLIVSVRGEQLRVFAVPDGADLDATLPTPPVPRTAPCHSRQLDVLAQRAPASTPADSPRLRLTIPALSLSVPWGGSDEVNRCTSRAYSAAGRHEVHCEHTEDGSYLHASVRENALLLEQTFNPFGSPMHHTLLGAIALPCGSSIRFRELTIPDAATVRRKDPGCLCQDQQDACEQRCTATLTDHTSALTEAGRACVTTCATTRDRCEDAKHCPPGSITPRCQCMLSPGHFEQG